MLAHSITLPSVGVPGGVRAGRVPAEGYERGWGLQFGSLAQQVEADPLFRAAEQAAAGRSIVSRQRLYNLYLLVVCYLPRLASRNIIEFGVYRGGTSLFMAHLLRQIDPDAVLYALDTFDGMPETDKSVDAHNPGDFQDADLAGFEQAATAIGNVRIAKGLFADTFPAIKAGCTTFGLAHIDCDIRSAVAYAHDEVWPVMTPGGYLVYDDATESSCLGATQAVEEMIMTRRVHSEQIWPHFVFRAGLS